MFLSNMTPLHIAVMHGKIDIIKLLLSHKNIDINAKDDVLYYFFFNCIHKLLF